MKSEYQYIPGCKPYMVNKNGDIIHDGIPVKTYITKQGYLRCIMPKSQGRKFIAVHRAVALTFIPNPNNYQQINHINGDKFDNRVKNLEWVTGVYNVKHAYVNKLRNDCYCARIIDKKENKILNFMSMKAAARFLEINGDTFVTYIYRSKLYPIYDRYVIDIPKEEYDKVTELYGRYTTMSKRIYCYDHMLHRLTEYDSVARLSMATGVNTYTVRSSLAETDVYYVGGYSLSYNKDFKIPKVGMAKADEDRTDMLSKPIMKFLSDYELYNYETKEVLKFKNTKELMKFLNVTSQQVQSTLKIARQHKRTGLIKGYGIRLDNSMDWHKYTEGQLICNKLGYKFDFRVYRVTEKNKTRYIIGDKYLCQEFNIPVQKLIYCIKIKGDYNKLVPDNIHLEYIP